MNSYNYRFYFLQIQVKKLKITLLFFLKKKNDLNILDVLKCKLGNGKESDM